MGIWEGLVVYEVTVLFKKHKCFHINIYELCGMTNYTYNRK